MISHVELYVSDLERSAHFWDWLLRLLGYQPFQSWPEGRSWRLNGFYLVLVRRPLHSLALAAFESALA